MSFTTRGLVNARRWIGAGSACLGALFGVCGLAAAQGPMQLTTMRVASGLRQPVWAGAPRGDTRRLFILEQRGLEAGTAHVRLLDLASNTLAETPFLSLTGLVAGGEAGLLGMAFHPEYAENGYFWLYYTVLDARRVVRYRAIGDPLTATAADPASAEVVISIPGHIANHNAGWIDFSPDGNLYVAVGDGGSSSRAQDLAELRGKLLRIDVDGADGVPGTADDDGFPADAERLYTVPADNPFVGVAGEDEIWAYGLRNPWRDDIDPATGDIYIADVGSGSWEEINFQPPSDGGSLPGYPGYRGGWNYGWPCREGTEGTSTLCGPEESLTYPFLVYGHSQEVPPTNATGCSVTGGVVYRGCAIPGLDGTYFFSDVCSARIFSLRYNRRTAITDFAERTAELDPGGDLSINLIVSFGRDAWGEVYICDLSGDVYKVVSRFQDDINGDNVADTCRCPADWDGNDATDSNDISAFLTAWLAAVTGGPTGADYDGSGSTDSNDISAFLASWLAALGGGC